MFDNIGGKIKTLAKVMCWIGIIVSVIYGIAMIILSFWAGVLTAIMGIVFSIIGAVLSWVGSFFTYGFGELIETNENSNASLRKIKSDLDNLKTSYMNNASKGEIKTARKDADAKKSPVEQSDDIQQDNKLSCIDNSEMIVSLSEKGNVVCPRCGLEQSSSNIKCTSCGTFFKHDHSSNDNNDQTRISHEEYVKRSIPVYVNVDKNGNITCPTCGKIQPSNRFICDSCRRTFVNGQPGIPYWCAKCGEKGPFENGVCSKCGSDEKIINEKAKKVEG